MTGPNGSATTVSVEYDWVGRLVKVIRQGNNSGSPTLQISYRDPRSVLGGADAAHRREPERHGAQVL